jgi:hypothetical protein
MSKDLSTKQQKVVDRPLKGSGAYPLDHLYVHRCDVCGRGMDSDGELEYSICAPKCDVLRTYCSIDCMARDVQPHIKALLVQHYRENLQPKAATTAGQD